MDTENHISGETQPRSFTPQGNKNTGWAIILAVVAALFFYFVYRLLFTLVTMAYASYDPSFATGFGALVLVVFGSNVLAFLSGAVVAKKVFPKASATGLFYGLATLLVILAIVSVSAEIRRFDSSWVVMLVNVVVVAVTFFVVRVYLLSIDA